MITLAFAAALQATGLPSAPLECGLDRVAFCILNFGQRTEVTERPSGAAIKVYPLEKSNEYGLILEPKTCDHNIADRFQLMRHRRAGVRYRGREWGELVLRLRSENRCDVRILYTPLYRDHVGSSFYTIVSMTKICFNSPCQGAVVSALLQDVLRDEERK
jgi:hypothetical protein